MAICAPCREELHEFCRGDQACDCDCLVLIGDVDPDEIDPPDDIWQVGQDRYEAEMHRERR